MMNIISYEDKMSYHASWLEANFSPDLLRFHAGNIAGEIEEDKETYNITAIAITGVSGMVIGGIISYITGIPIIVVRKELSHSVNYVECPDGDSGYERGNYVFVDDFVGSGETLTRVTKMIAENTGYGVCAKVYIYNYKMHSSTCKDYTGSHIPFFASIKE
jgi:adenine/guanine phosphoribosyltransferase-like PRPP-binding protein